MASGKGDNIIVSWSGKQLGFVEYFLQCVFHLASGLPVTKVTGTK